MRCAPHARENQYASLGVTSRQANLSPQGEAPLCHKPHPCVINHPDARCPHTTKVRISLGCCLAHGMNQGANSTLPHGKICICIYQGFIYNSTYL